MEVADVIAAVICHERRYLVGLRPVSKRHGGKWEFPGGKLLDKETLADAAVRELGEELELTVVETGQVLLSVPDEEAGVVVHFCDVVAEGSPVALEHDEIRWCSAEQLRGLNLAPADARFVKEMLW